MWASDERTLAYAGGFQTLGSFPCCSPLPKGLKPNHNKQQTQGKGKKKPHTKTTHEFLWLPHHHPPSPTSLPHHRENTLAPQRGRNMGQIGKGSIALVFPFTFPIPGGFAEVCWQGEGRAGCSGSVVCGENLLRHRRNLWASRESGSHHLYPAKVTSRAAKEALQLLHGFAAIALWPNKTASGRDPAKPPPSMQLCHLGGKK